MTEPRHREWGPAPIYRHEWGLLGLAIGLQILIILIACWALWVLP